MKKFLSLGAVLLMLCLIPSLFAADQSDLTDPTVLRFGEKLPVLDVTLLNNSTISTAQLKYPAIISIFTTWCSVCKKELPLLNLVLTDARSKNIPLTIVGINAGEGVKKVSSYQKKQGLDFDLWVDTNLSLVKRLQIKGTPVILIFNKKGELAYQGHRIPGDWQTLVQ
jgi:thiol-disulfide isomerase/thioredoxin